MRRPGIASLGLAAVLPAAGLAGASLTPAAGSTLGAAWAALGFTSAAFTGTDTLAAGAAGVAALASATGLAGVSLLAAGLLASAWAWAMAPGLFRVLAMASARASRLSAAGIRFLGGGAGGCGLKGPAKGLNGPACITTP